MSKQTQDAFIVAATRTPVGKAPRGVFRNTRPDDMLAHVLRSVVAEHANVTVVEGDAQELGWTMAVAVHYLRVLTEAGFALVAN